MIPKTIHYCWFGHGEKSKLAEKCICSWKKYCPDYEIIEWNEETYDLSSAPPYVKQALEAKKWAFATDYIRYQVVYEHGGIYFDTDVEVVRNIDALRENKAFFGIQYNELIASGLGFGAEKGLPLLRELMRNYEETPFILPDGKMNAIACPTKDTPVFEAHGFVLNGSNQVLEDDIHIYSAEYFCPRSWFDGKVRITKNTYTIHWFEGSWFSEKKRSKLRRKRFIRRILFAEQARRIKHALFKKRKG